MGKLRYVVEQTFALLHRRGPPLPEHLTRQRRATWRGDRRGADVRARKAQAAVPPAGVRGPG
ncbi:hypothetical protein [Streptomyces sp. NPDC005281]|uniref:hypothetical protein n=1 Tax=Streptomyces sp. NPDC005281 TaxID=3155712 RepID=UPI0033AAB0DC